MHLGSAPVPRMSRSFTSRHSITTRRTVSPADSTQSADDVALPLPGVTQAGDAEEPTQHSSPAWTHAMPSTPTTVSRVCTGAFGFTQRVWYAVVHAADSWWSKFRAVMRGVLRCTGVCYVFRLCVEQGGLPWYRHSQATLMPVADMPHKGLAAHIFMSLYNRGAYRRPGKCLVAV